MPPQSHATRLLCSAVLIERGFAELVFKTLCVPQVRAIAPAPGVDLVLLARHAAYAVRQRRRIEGALCGYLAVAGVPVVGLVLAADLALLWLSLVLGVVIAAKVRVVQHDMVLARQATQLIDAGRVDVDLGSGLVIAEHEQRLAAVNAADLSIYAWQRAFDPFPGLGQRIDTRVPTPVRIDQPADEAKPIRPVTTSGLLDHLTRTMPAYIDADPGRGNATRIDATQITNSYQLQPVLYVLGSAVEHIDGLLPEQNGPPVQRAPARMLRDTADRPSRVTRTYLRAQIIGHGGQVVATLNVSAVVEPSELLLDLAIHVLRPVHDAYHAADRLPREPSLLATKLATRNGLLPGLLGAPVRTMRLDQLLRDADRPATLTPEQLRAYGTQDFYGALLGLREVTSYNSRFDFNQRTDADRYGHVLMVGMLNELVAYLETCNVDTSALEEQRKDIINNYFDAATTVVNGSYVSGGSGGLTVAGDLTVGRHGAPNLGRTA